MEWHRITADCVAIWSYLLNKKFKTKLQREILMQQRAHWQYPSLAEQGTLFMHSYAVCLAPSNASASVNPSCPTWISWPSSIPTPSPFCGTSSTRAWAIAQPPNDVMVLPKIKLPWWREAIHRKGQNANTQGSFTSCSFKRKISGLSKLQVKMLFAKDKGVGIAATYAETIFNHHPINIKNSNLA